MTPARNSSSDTLRDRFLALAVAILSLWPLAQNWTTFHSLFYFEDEWDLIDRWDKSGFGPWCLTAFAENFVPLFKTLWGGGIVVFGGSYFALILLLWLTHAVNVFLVVKISRRVGADNASAALAGIILGLSSINHESLAWSVQWSSVLSFSFFLLGLTIAMCRSEQRTEPDWRMALILGACALASALCFSRGVLTGFSFAVWLLFTGGTQPRWLKRICLTLVIVLPSAGVAAWIFLNASGNNLHLSETMRPALIWAFHCFAQSPLRVFFSDETPALGGVVALAVLKTALFAIGFLLAPRNTRPAFLALLAFEIGDMLLLGVGRYHTGIPASGSSRYQYGALITLLPFVAISVARCFALLASRKIIRTVTTYATVILIAWLVQSPWRGILRNWIPSRGRDVRAELFGNPPAPEPKYLSHLPWIPNERARFLVAKYHLH